MSQIDWSDEYEAGTQIVGSWIRHNRVSRPFWNPKTSPEPDDSARWCWVEYERRINADTSCDPADISNEAFILRQLSPYMADDPRVSCGPGPDVIDGARLGVGRGYAIRVFCMPDECSDEYPESALHTTFAFDKWCRIQRRLQEQDDILDPADYNYREYMLWYDATRRSIVARARYKEMVPAALPRGWDAVVLEWLRHNSPSVEFEGGDCKGEWFGGGIHDDELRYAIHLLGLHARICEDWGRIPKSVVDLLAEPPKDSVP